MTQIKGPSKCQCKTGCKSRCGCKKKHQPCIDCNCKVHPDGCQNPHTHGATCETCTTPDPELHLPNNTHVMNVDSQVNKVQNGNGELYNDESDTDDTVDDFDDTEDEMEDSDDSEDEEEEFLNNTDLEVSYDFHDYEEYEDGTI